MADISDNSNYVNERTILASLLTDITAVRTALNAVVTKLNADA
jgi:hypothetical protein